MEAVRKQLTGTAFDGAYEGAEQGNVSGLKVPAHLNKELDLDGDWTGSKWDGGHLIERAMVDTNKDVLCAFHKEVVDLAMSVNKRYLYGKKKERVIGAAERVKKALHAIGTICETRFSMCTSYLPYLLLSFLPSYLLTYHSPRCFLLAQLPPGARFSRPSRTTCRGCTRTCRRTTGARLASGRRPRRCPRSSSPHASSAS